MEGPPNKYTVSIDRMQKAMSGMPARKQKAIGKLVNRLEKLANNSQGYLARIDRGQNIIELSRPLDEVGAQNLDSFSKQEILSTAPAEDTIRDLHTTGYKTHQIANKLKISDQAVTAALDGGLNE